MKSKEKRITSTLINSVYSNLDPVNYDFLKMAKKSGLITDFEKKSRKRKISFYDNERIVGYSYKLTNDLQIIRFYDVSCELKRQTIKSETVRAISINEVFRIFITSDGRKFIQNKRINTCWYYWKFDTSSDFGKVREFKIYNSIRALNYSYLIKFKSKIKALKYFDNFNFYYKTNSKINGYCSNVCTNLDYLFRYIEDSSFFDTLRETNNYQLAHLVFIGGITDELKNRLLKYPNKLIPTYDHKELENYLHYLRTADDYKIFDLKNPIYLSFDKLENFKRVEKTCYKRANRIRKQQQYLIDCKKAEEEENIYQARIKKFLNLDLGNNDLKISIIPTVQSMLDEAVYMGNCLFTLSYYRKKDSLIFRCVDRSSGQSIEDIEYSISENKVLQDYGRFNKKTDYSKLINKLINKNKNLIKEAIA